MQKSFPASRAAAAEIGSLFYFTGHPCKRGHIAARYTSTCICTGCTKERQQQQEYKDASKIRARERRKDPAVAERQRVDAVRRYHADMADPERAKRRRASSNASRDKLRSIPEWKQGERERQRIRARAFREDPVVAELGRQQAREYAKAHSEKRAAAEAKRRAHLGRACPPWADRFAIEAVYAACPDDHHVDHIVPLRGVTHDGRRVCGLHVESNLRHLPKETNVSRGNRMTAEELAMVERAA